MSKNIITKKLKKNEMERKFVFKLPLKCVRDRDFLTFHYFITFPLVKQNLLETQFSFKRELVAVFLFL